MSEYKNNINALKDYFVLLVNKNTIQQLDRDKK